MRINVIILVGFCLTLANVADAARQTPRTEEEKTLYALGVLISGNLQPFALTAKELEMVEAGITDGVQNKSNLEDLESYGPKLQQLQKTRMASAAGAEKSAGAAYIARAAAEAGAARTPSGIVIKTLTTGKGPSPTAADQVKVHYEGRFVNGEVFDSSIGRNEPATFPLKGVIPCWTEALQLMKVGGKARIVCPSALAYGDEGRPPQMPGGATLVFEVELLDIVTGGTVAPPLSGK